MEIEMGYVIAALIALPLIAVWSLMIAMATGLVRERAAVETIAHNYGTSWKSAHLLD